MSRTVFGPRYGYGGNNVAGSNSKFLLALDAARTLGYETSADSMMNTEQS